VLAALAGSLFLAFLPALPLPHKAGHNSPALAMTPVASPAKHFAFTSSDRSSKLWTLLIPWAIATDGIALLGLGVVFLVRAEPSRRRGARM